MKGAKPSLRHLAGRAFLAIVDTHQVAARRRGKTTASSAPLSTSIRTFPCLGTRSFSSLSVQPCSHLVMPLVPISLSALSPAFLCSSLAMPCSPPLSLSEETPHMRSSLLSSCSQVMLYVYRNISSIMNSIIVILLVTVAAIRLHEHDGWFTLPSVWDQVASPI